MSKSSQWLIMFPLVLIITSSSAGPNETNSSDLTQECIPKLGQPEVIFTSSDRQQVANQLRGAMASGEQFAWPDTPLGFIKSGSSYTLFASDGSKHIKPGGETLYGSITSITGDLNKLPSSKPKERFISNIKAPHNRYSYVGAGPIYQVARNKWLIVYHTERLLVNNGFYSTLGLAKSTDNGEHWVDLGSIVEPHQVFQPNMQSFEIGDPPLVKDRTGEYFYIYFSDLIDTNSSENPNGRRTAVSVARVNADSLITAAFSTAPIKLPAFKKYFAGSWDEPGINGNSADLQPKANYGGSPFVAYNKYLDRYILIGDDGKKISYSESKDGLVWTTRQLLFELDAAIYATLFGLENDPNILGREFMIYYTTRPWSIGSLQRVRVSCSASKDSGE